MYSESETPAMKENMRLKWYSEHAAIRAASQTSIVPAIFSSI